MKTILSACTALLFMVGVASAQVLPPPPLPPPPAPVPDPDPAPAPKTDSGDHGGHRGEISGESIMLWQGIAIGCSAVSTMVHAGITAGAERELTPLEAVDDSARCTFIPAMLVSLIAHASGMKDDACTYAVARDALRGNNSPRAREELFWRDGSWERRQRLYLDRYFDCYHGVKQSKKLRVRHVRHRRHRHR